MASKNKRYHRANRYLGLAAIALLDKHPDVASYGMAIGLQRILERDYDRLGRSGDFARIVAENGTRHRKQTTSPPPSADDSVSSPSASGADGDGGDRLPDSPTPSRQTPSVATPPSADEGAQ